MTVTNMKKVTLSTIALLAAVAFAGAPTMDIVDTAAGNKDFSTLVGLVQRAGLVETLKGRGPFTVFAPTNEAFSKLPRATLDAVQRDRDRLRSVLTFHVVPGNVMAADVVKLNGKRVKTVNGAELSVRVRDGKVFLNNVQVVKTDIRTTNGVIHVLDGVLVPPTGQRTNNAGRSSAGCNCK